MTLVEFLLARVAEDEAEAAHVPVEYQDEDGLEWWGEYGHISVAPSRILAECEAKRRICDNALQHSSCERGYSESYYPVQLLAAVYSDHPDYAKIEDYS